MFRESCVRPKKKEKSVYKSRCRCDKCLQRRRRENDSVPVKMKESEAESNSGILSPSVTNRKSQSNSSSEEIVLKVTNYQQ